MRFSATQAAALVSQWRLVYHQQNTPDGFSSTLFESVDKPGTYVYALRGSEVEKPWADVFATDVFDIVTDGLALHQIVDMYNDWQRITAEKGAVYTAARLDALVTETTAYQLARAGQFVPGFGMTASAYLQYLKSRTDIVVNGPLGVVQTVVFGDSDLIFNDERSWGAGLTTAGEPGATAVAGQSLGGHLAAAFTRLFPETDASAVTINGAGFATGLIDGLSGYAEVNIRNLFAGLQGASSFDVSKIRNIYGEKGLEFVTQNGPGLFQQGSHEPIFIESLSPNDSLGHGASQMTDSLAVYDLLSRLDPALNTSTGIGKITEILEAASKDTASSFEAVLDSLRRLFKDPAAASPVSTAAGDREQFYRNFFELQGLLGSYAGKVTVDSLALSDATQIANLSHASEATAYRYALRELNPFAIVGDNAIYEQHNLGGGLDLYDTAVGVGMTSRYLWDRAEMLKWKNFDFSADGQRALRTTHIETYQYNDKNLKDPSGNELTFTVTGRQRSTLGNPAKIIFGSEAGEPIIGSDLAAGDHLYGGGGDDELDGRDGNDYLEGGAGADILLGGEGDDELVGGVGNDTLAGGAGRDVLDGGIGFDTYKYFSGDGPDTIADADEKGQILYDGILLAGGVSVGPGLWRSVDDRFQFMLHEEEDGTETLSVSGSGALFIKDFTSGALGITLENASAPTITPPVGGRTIFGMYAPQIFDDPPDLDSPPPDHQYTPVVATPYPHDYLLLDDLGNLVRDPARPWTGGFQQLYGSDGGDQIIGSDSGNGMAGYAGSDYLRGGRSPDGAGGGEGNDFIEGGAFFDAPLEDWVNVAAPFPEGEIQGVSDDRLFGGAGDDVIFGGTAADLESLLDPATPSAGHKGDWVAGELGDDRLHGSTGDDVVLGGGGKDRLIGGPGDDVLVGDDSFATSHTTNPADGGWMWRIDGGISPADIQFFPISVMPWLDWSESYYKRAGDDDVLFGGSGDDVLIGQLGDDALLGETGNDALAGWEGDDTLLGGDGDDVMSGDFGRYEQANDRLVGLTHSVPAGFLDLNTGDSGEPEQSGSDYLDGGSGHDVLYGEGGNDTVLGGAGNDVIWGDAGYLPDHLHGADYLDGGSGNDTLHGGYGDDTLIGSIGDDILDGGEGSDTYIYAQGDGADFIEDSGWEGTDVLVFRDYLQSEVSITRELAGGLTITGAPGDAITIQSLAGNEGSGIEHIQFADGTVINHDAIEGLPVALDSIPDQNWNIASDTDDVIDAFSMPSNSAGGFLLLDAGAGNDVVFGDSNAVVSGNEGNDQLFGGKMLIGGEGNDHLADGITLLGGPGDDQLYNGALLVGGSGNDFLDGGFGPSHYLISVEDAGHDTIYESAGLDQFALAEWYYPSIGIPDWEDRLFDPNDEDTVSIGTGIKLGLLPPLPLIAPHDYAALESLYDAGVIDIDALVIGPGIVLDDLALSWETVRLISPVDGDLGPCVVLNVGITHDNVVALVIPRSSDLLGAGIEEVRFADGTAITMGELIALAPPAPDFDPAFVPNGSPVFVFEAGDGVHLIDDPGVTTIEFGAGITADMLTLGVGSLLIRVGAQGDEIHVLNFDPNDAFTSQIEHIAFADGAQISYEELIARGFDFVGTEDDDFLTGTNANDHFYGLGGNDFYYFEPVLGFDTVVDEAGGVDTVYISGGITPESVTVTRMGDYLTLELGPADHISIRWQPEAGYQIEEVWFDDGTAWDAGTLESLSVTAQNTAPTVANPIADQTGQEDEAFSFALPADTFVDADAGDVLSISATLPDGASLPYWLAFDATTRSFGGIPTNDDVGSFDVAVTATDGSGLSAGDTFTLTVENTNDAPFLETPLSNQSGHQNSPFEFAVPNVTFADVDVRDSLAFDATLSDGWSLPAWLEFNPATQTFTGAPGEDDAGLYSISVIATDIKGATAIAGFDLMISDAATTFARHHGTKRSDVIRTGFDNDLVEAGKGDDYIFSGAGRDLILADKGDDHVHGDAGNDYLLGGKGSDHLFGQAGSDVLFGEHGDDHLEGGAGNNVLDGGKGKDRLIAGSGNNLLIGGPGSDILYGGSAHDVFLFNRGDDKATLHLEGAAIAGNTDTISLGKGITADDIILRRKNDDLIVKVDESDDDDGAVNVVLKGWYETGGDRRTVTRLQLINERIEIYDFTALAARFEAATGGRARLWHAGPVMSEALLSSSDTEAIGGALAHQYATRGSLAYASVPAIQATLADPLFGGDPQPVADDGGPTLAPFFATGDEDDGGSAQDFVALVSDPGTVTGPAPVIQEPTDGVVTPPYSRRKGRHKDDGFDDGDGLEALIESWFGRARNKMAALGMYLEEQNWRRDEHRGGGRGHHYSDKDEIAACWRRTKVLLEAHLANQDPAVMTGGEGHGFSGMLGSFWSEQPIVPGEKLSRVSGHHLRRLEGLEEGLNKLSM